MRKKMTPKYPEVKVKLIGENGNAFSIIEKCRQAAKKACINAIETDKFMNEAVSGDYNNLLRVCMEWWTIT
jgi:hypothetical protein